MLQFFWERYVLELVNVEDVCNILSGVVMEYSIDWNVFVQVFIVWDMRLSGEQFVKVIIDGIEVLGGLCYDYGEDRLYFCYFFLFFFE